MKRLLFLAALVCSLQAQAQWAVSAPVLETTTVLNHVESMQQAAQTYQSIMNVQQGIEKTIENIEKVNSYLTTIHQVQEVANKSGACINRIRKTYDMVTNMKLDVQSTTALLEQCNQCARECVTLSAYGSKIFTDKFLKMSDKDRLDETRQLLDDIDKLLGKVNYVGYQAKAVQFNNQMIKAYIH